jgi:hypothetical protein
MSFVDYVLIIGVYFINTFIGKFSTLENILNKLYICCITSLGMLIG